MTSLCLPVVVGVEEAERFFGRPRLGNCFGLFAQKAAVAVNSDPATRVLPFIERLWLPSFAVRVHATSPKAERSVWTAVEGINGEFSLLECDEELDERALDGDVFPATIDETRAAALARKGAMLYILRQRGLINKPIVDGIEEIRPYHYPRLGLLLPPTRVSRRHGAGRAHREVRRSQDADFRAARAGGEKKGISQRGKPSGRQSSRLVQGVFAAVIHLRDHAMGLH